MNRVKRYFAGKHATEQRSRTWMEEEDPDCAISLPEEPPPILPAASGEWKASLAEALATWMEALVERLRNQQQLAALANKVQTLERRLSSLTVREAVIAPLNSLAPKPFEVIKEIKVVIEQYDQDEFLATFYDANVNASGRNQTNAYDNLKEVLVHTFELLDSLPPEKLGPGPRKQLAVLREFIRRTS